jgi:uncharacterized membrane protein YedE/YeeE
MNAPLYETGAFGEGVSLLLALLLGIGFGFALERAGFGSARKLTSQFYLDDLAVFKVMFTAIVTAMIGTSALAWAGMLDLSLVALVPTYWIAQVAGGLLLGVGFVVGGYCPGTGVAAAATGRLDGLVTLLGILAGCAGFAFAYPALQSLYLAGDMGEQTLPDFFGVPRALVVVAVLAMALAGFAAAHAIERRFADRRV